MTSPLGYLSTRLVKDAFEYLILELTFLYNQCLDTGCFPVKWGTGVVTPIPKTSSLSKEARDLRPITQISLPGKLLERLVHSQLVLYFERNNILFDNQHGFRSEKLTTTAVFKTLKNLFENWNHNLYS